MDVKLEKCKLQLLTFYDRHSEIYMQKIHSDAIHVPELCATSAGIGIGIGVGDPGGHKK